MSKPKQICCVGIVVIGVFAAFVSMQTQNDRNIYYGRLPDSILNSSLVVKRLDESVADVTLRDGLRSSKWSYQAITGSQLSRFPNTWFILVSGVDQKAPSLEFLGRIGGSEESHTGRWQLLIAVDEPTGETWELRIGDNNLEGFGEFLCDRQFKIANASDCEILWGIAKDLRFVQSECVVTYRSGEWHLEALDTDGTFVVRTDPNGIVSSLHYVDR
ncbi:MAG: hypothetical protein H8E37_12850 [Planctomycetes bacterium]|nr:hypothetical protein [Planctomycetota bacterium]